MTYTTKPMYMTPPMRTLGSRRMVKTSRRVMLRSCAFLPWSASSRALRYDRSSSVSHLASSGLCFDGLSEHARSFVCIRAVTVEGESGLQGWEDEEEDNADDEGKAPFENEDPSPTVVASYSVH